MTDGDRSQQQNGSSHHEGVIKQKFYECVCLSGMEIAQDKIFWNKVGGWGGGGGVWERFLEFVFTCWNREITDFNE